MKSLAPLLIIGLFLCGLTGPLMIFFNVTDWSPFNILLSIIVGLISCYSFYFSFTLLKLHLKEN